MAALKEGDVVICGCCDQTLIIGHVYVNKFVDTWFKDGNDDWTSQSHVDPKMIKGWHYHPDPDRVHAEFAAAQLRGEVDEAR